MQTTNGSVIATLETSHPWTIQNNSGSPVYEFTSNGSFTFELKLPDGSILEVTAEVDWIDTSLNPANLIVARRAVSVPSTGWQWNSFDLSYSSPPVVIPTPITVNDGENYPIPLIRDVSTTGFFISACVDKGNSLCGPSTQTHSFDYMVFDRDVAKLYSRIDVGVLSSSTLGLGDYFSLRSVFDVSPYVWTAAQTYSQDT